MGEILVLSVVLLIICLRNLAFFIPFTSFSPTLELLSFQGTVQVLDVHNKGDYGFQFSLFSFSV